MCKETKYKTDLPTSRALKAELETRKKHNAGENRARSEGLGERGGGGGGDSIYKKGRDARREF